MAGKKIKVNTNNLKNDANEVLELTKQAKANIKKMYDAVSELDGMWDGPANEAFMNQFRNDYEAFIDLCSYVENLSSKMKSSSNEYNKCEDNVYQLINKIKI